jgi:hypothetical protein
LLEESFEALSGDVLEASDVMATACQMAGIDREPPQNGETPLQTASEFASVRGLGVVPMLNIELADLIAATGSGNLLQEAVAPPTYKEGEASGLSLTYIYIYRLLHLRFNMIITVVSAF